MTKFGTLADELESDFPAVDVTSVVFSRDFVGVGGCVIPQEKVLEIIAALRLASMPDREAIAKAIYSSWMDVAPDRASEHMAWFHDGESNPDSCVHYSNVAKAFDAADSILALTRAQRTDDQTS